MSHQPTPRNDVRDELVAYLDGELPLEECRRIEQQLSTDEQYREQIQGLDDVWQALDELPQTTVDDAFSRTTLEMVTVAAEQDLTAQTAALPARRRRRSLLVGAVVAAALLAGFIITRMVLPDPNRDLIAQLPVIQLVDVYTEVEDLEFLRRLRASANSTHLADGFREIQPQVAELREVSLASPHQRQLRVEQMTADQQAELAARSKRFFQQLSSDEQTRIRALHQQIVAADDSRELQETMLAYGQWLAKRTPGERADLRDRPIEERIQRIRELARRDERKSLKDLSVQDLAAIRNEALQLFDQRRPIVERMLQRHGVDDVRAKIDSDRPLLVQIVVHHALESDRGGDRTLDRFLQVLSEPVRRRMQDMRDDHAAHFVRRWVRHAFRDDVTAGDLEHFFANELSNARREELLAMPADQMEEVLHRQYVREKLGYDDDFDDFDRRSPRNGDRDRRHPEDGPPDEIRPLRGPPPRHDGPLDGPPPGPRQRNQPSPPDFL